LGSYWEIHEPSNLAYDTGRGLRNATYQFGPPVGSAAGGADPLMAWLDDGRTPGSGNCNGWTESSGYQGQAAYLEHFSYLDTRYNLYGVDCSEQHHVWCVSDPPAPFLLNRSTEER
jgi:hypothetical protein